ncbi:MAG: hypothetical protein H6748_18535 [Spirochaetaceae bacterium]|nr:hypothetical protein [Myxococcales bacterium]MCB9726054.1 hypothetical protein [Spirochaetaceae bacterium]HPG25301.1 hypothetical protein [Myxococcota bacterium]
MRFETPPGRARGSTWLVGLAALAGLVLQAACAMPPPPWREVPNYPVRFSDLRTITLVPPLVSVYAMSEGNFEQEVDEWSDAAYEHARNAIRERVEGMGKRFVPYAGKEGPRPDFRVGVADVNARRTLSPAGESWLLFESVKEAILRHTYDLTQVFPARIKDFDYTLGPDARALLAGTDADAYVLMIATDAIPTKGRQALVGVGAAAALYTGSYGGPGATPAELTLALVESDSGDILYFNRVSMPLSDLRDEASNRKLVDMVLKGMDR